ncbi:MAG: pyrroloquinoline quinone biosynthesis protein C, partial [Coxiellaceae bacterium]|nr:pyrroloquinoline quinone biosynthesis protein C [Coxiellaceae bacterium]
MTKPWTQDQFLDQMMALRPLYHIFHPFNIRMANGELTQRQIQCWVANRFYYQTTIPKKDAAILSNSDDPAFRRKWIQRIMDHDNGGIEAWLQLADAVGLDREECLSQHHVLPGVRFAVDAYLNFAKSAPWYEAVCSSLTELFAPQIHEQRLATWPEHYPWIDPKGFA